MTARVFVTGGAGFIGSHLCARLWSAGHHVFCFDSFDDFYAPAAKHDNVQRLVTMAGTAGRMTFHRGDIRDVPTLQQVFQAHRPDVVIHLAGLAGVRPSIAQPQLYSEVNVQGTLHVLECCRQFGVQCMLFGSSSSVYGARARGPFAEDDGADTPISPYAATKRAGELLCYTYAHLHHLRIACLRFFTVYGPRQRPDLVIHKFARLLTTGQPLPVYGDGTSERDYTYVDDTVEGMVQAWQWLQRQEAATRVYEIFNLGSSSPISLIALIRLLETAFGRPANLAWQAAQPGDVPVTFADLRKAHAYLGYQPAVDIATGIQRFATWFQQRTVHD